MGNNSVNLFWIWTCGLEGGVVSGALAALLFSGAELFMQILYRLLWGTILWNYFEFGPMVQVSRLFSSRAPAAPLFSGAEPFVQFWWKTSQGTILWNCFEFGVVVQDEMSFKDISYLELWRPLCSTEQNHLCNFKGEYPEEHFYESIFNLDLWSRRWCCLKYFLSGALAVLVFSGADPYMQFE